VSVAVVVRCVVAAGAAILVAAVRRAVDSVVAVHELAEHAAVQVGRRVGGIAGLLTVAEEAVVALHAAAPLGRSAVHRAPAVAVAVRRSVLGR